MLFLTQKLKDNWFKGYNIFLKH